jgi:hypothetical protein
MTDELIYPYHAKVVAVRDMAAMLDMLKDTYDAEHQITKALPKMIEAAKNRELKKANEILRLASAFSPRRSSTAASSREGVRR